MGVSKNSGFYPQIIHGLMGFSIIFTIHFGVPLFLETSIYPKGCQIHHPLGFKDGTPTGRCWHTCIYMECILVWIWWWFTRFTPICNSTCWRHIMDHVSYVSCIVSIHVIYCVSITNHHTSTHPFIPLQCVLSTRHNHWFTCSSYLYPKLMVAVLRKHKKNTNNSNQTKLQQVGLSQFFSMFSQFGESTMTMLQHPTSAYLLLATRCVLYPTLEHYVLETTRVASVHELRQNTD